MTSEQIFPEKLTEQYALGTIDVERDVLVARIRGRNATHQLEIGFDVLHSVRGGAVRAVRWAIV